jgi:hypothetical protein
MRVYSNNKGFALITSLMLTLISLTIVMALLYMITQGTQQSGQNKKYRTALEASYGGAELFTKDILPFVLKNYSSTTFMTDIASNSNFGAVNIVVGNQKCLQVKLKNATSGWGTCNNTADPAVSPDLTFTMPASTNGIPFTVYSKIVDTVNGNTDISGLQLEGAGVAESQAVLSPPHFPYVYRVEIQGQRQSSSTAKANIEVLYAY